MLPKQNRITLTKEFEKFFGPKFKRGGGRSLSTAAFVFKAIKNGLDDSRFGFMVGTKVDNRASVRNKVKRRLRAIAHDNLERLIGGIDFLVVAMKPAATLEFDEVKTQMAEFFKKTRVLK